MFGGREQRSGLQGLAPATCLSSWALGLCPAHPVFGPGFTCPARISGQHEAPHLQLVPTPGGLATLPTTLCFSIVEEAAGIPSTNTDVGAVPRARF